MHCVESRFRSAVAEFVSRAPGVSVRYLRLHDLGGGHYSIDVAFAGPPEALALLGAEAEAIIQQQQQQPEG